MAKKEKEMDIKEDMHSEEGDPSVRECALCGCEETAPDAKDPCILTVYSTEMKKYLCSKCYNSMKELDEYAEPTVKMIEILD